jgi:hypothetical protein
LLDANVFISAARDYYAFDIVPKFWEWLEEHARTQRVQSIDRVKEELLKGKDKLADWIKGSFAEAFAPTGDPDVIAAYSEIVVWAEAQDQFMPAAKAEFAGNADGWLVAYAKTRGMTVVTHEGYFPDVHKRVPIPNVCRAFSVEYVNTYAMLRGLGARLS